MRVINMLRVAIVEDDETTALQLQDHLEQFGRENSISVQVNRFSDGAKLVGDYRHGWDLLLLDVDMPVMNGIETAQAVRQVDAQVLVIFITNLAQYAIKGYEVDALDYVLKPVSYYALAMRLKKALRMLRSSDERALMLKRDGDVVRVPLSQIYYIEIYSHSLIYHTADEVIKITGAYNTLTELERGLAGDGFARCHNCYLVNLRYVDGIGRATLKVFGTELPISRGRRKTVMDQLMAYAKGGSR